MLESLLIEILLLYGLSFTFLGTVALFLAADPNNVPLARHFRLFGWFGLLHGAKEFVDVWTQTRFGGESDLCWIATCLGICSFGFLAEFARRAVNEVHFQKVRTERPRLSLKIYLIPTVVGLLAISAAENWLQGLGAASRYSLALPGALSAAWAFTRAYHSHARRARVFGAALIGYAILGGLVTGQIDGFYTWLPTHQVFLQYTGVPVQLLRAALAFLMLYSLSTLAIRETRAARSRHKANTIRLLELSKSQEERVQELAQASKELVMVHYALNSSKSALIIADLSGIVRFANPAVVDLWEMELSSDALQRSMSDYFLSESRAQSVLREVETEGFWEGEVLGLSDRNRPMVLSLSVNMVDSDLGKPKIMMASFLDITDMRNAADALKREQDFASALIDAAPIVILLLSQEGVIEHVNPYFEKLTGFQLAEVVGKDWFDTFLPERDRERIRALFQGVRQGDRAAGNVNPILTRTGDECEIEWCDAKIEQGGEGAYSILAIGVDVTEARKAEAEQAEAGAKLEASRSQLLEAQRIAHLGSWELDLVENRLDWSDEIYAIFEVNSGNFSASYETFLDLIHPEDRGLVAEAFEDSVAERTSYSIEHRLLMPDGRIKWVEELGQTHYNSQGEAIRSAGTVQDITHAKSTEQKLRVSLQEKETLLREVHHRVKNNLQVISSLLYFQAKKIKHPDDLEVIVDGRDRLRAMMLVHEQLYRSADVSRVDFASYITALAGQLAESSNASQRSITISLDVQNNDVPLDQALPFGMILCELVSNALKHAFPSGRAGHVRILSSSEDDEVMLSVCDDGVGFGEDFSVHNSSSFGWQLIVRLADQIGASLATSSSAGTVVTVRVPKEAQAL